MTPAVVDPARPPLVLFVDDNEDIRLLYAHYLTSQGMRVVTVGNVFDAIRKALHETPDVIVMDINMPDLDGWEGTRRLKSHPRTGAVPVIVLTASAHETPSARVEAFIAKPCLPEVLGAQIRALLPRPV